MIWGEYIIYLITAWVSAAFVALAITAITRYRIATVLRELWLFLSIIIVTYAIAYALEAVYYMCILAMYGKVPVVQGGKSIPGLIAVLFSALITSALTYITGYISSSGRRVLEYILLRDPLLALVNVLGWASFLYVSLSPSDAIYFVFDKGATVVYSNTALILGAMFLATWLHIPYLLFKETGSKVTYRSVVFPLKVLTMVAYSELLVGYFSMFTASVFHVDTYVVMSVFFLLTSIVAVSILYKELTSPFTQYSLAIASQVGPGMMLREAGRKRPAGEGEVRLEGRIAVRFEPEEDYHPILKEIIDKASQERKVIILAPLNSILLKYIYKRKENVLRLPFAITGTVAPSPNVLPANNLSLIVNTVLNAARELGNEVFVVIDGLSDLIMVNDLRRVYIALKQLSELLPQATLIVSINWRALSEKEYSAIVSLFDQIYSIEEGRLRKIKGIVVA